MSKTHLISSHNHFDLADFVRNITNVEVAAQIAQSVAWRIDTLIQSNARALFKFVREHKGGEVGIDNLADLTMALGEAAFAEQAFLEAGAAHTGPVTAIKELMFVRDDWHDLATELTSMTIDYLGRPRTYERPDLDESFAKKPEMKLSQVSKQRAKQGMERRAQAYGLSKEDIDAQLAKKLARKEASLNEVADVMHSQAHITFLMFQLACQIKATTEIGEKFYTMDIATQRTLIDSAITAAERTEDRAEDNRSLSDSAYDDICMNVLLSVRTLRDVLRSSRFTSAQFAENAAARNVG